MRKESGGRTDNPTTRPPPWDGRPGRSLLPMEEKVQTGKPAFAPYSAYIIIPYKTHEFNIRNIIPTWEINPINPKNK